MEIQIHASVRIRPTYNNTDQIQWIVDHLETRRRFSLPIVGVMLLLVCIEPIDEKIAAKKIGSRLSSIPIEVLEQLLENLKSKKLLIMSTDLNNQKERECMVRFAQQGWERAWDYLLLTYNYPFVNYAADGRAIDAKLMEEYGQSEADISRFKKYSYPLNRYPLPKIEINLVPVNVRTAYNNIQHKDWGIKELYNLCAVAFGRTGIINQNQFYPTSEPLYMKTSPSMGARHPVEAYVWVRAVNGLNEGFYHVCVGDHQLDYLSDRKLSSEELSEWIPEINEVRNEPPRAILVLTAVFERSMYRYREPHIFRTIHLDVGHLSASVELIANSCGMIVANFSITKVFAAELLDAEFLNEGAMAAIALW
ncbi:SagB/ThcOx family dehydrogenase [Paenibacillus polysaccharolyticus]|uniref:SagB/ThcOx family dehydrogenase n=1 Tax=Paenibacillus polysaccharolyticus TaxID=582692 RepID=UPI00209ED5DE|nr:SagB/ThcOx family dehydrogenase [Paenibacillus polysaccharolyticus]MCP1133373.1 SagB/ThcOx family dehydrogenase [Paenibacillus polysaccharolyticus]